MSFEKQKILITGASGCVGQYISAWLLRNSNADLFLWLREPKKLTAVDPKDPRVNLLVGDIRDPQIYSEELKHITRVIHTATAWGDPKRAYEVNIHAVKKMLNLLDPDVLEQIIYFSTASILTKDLKPLPEAFKYGTEYIQTKARCLKELESNPLASKIIAVFPTLVFGGKINGSSDFPRSYLTEGLLEASKWLWLARFFRAYSRFHFIHAEDIACVCGTLATKAIGESDRNKEKKLRYLVLAQPHLTIDHAIDKLLEWRGIRKMPRLPLWGWLINGLIKFLPIQINSWDRFSIKQRHFDHDQISPPERFGGTSYAKSIQEIIADSGLTKRQKV